MNEINKEVSAKQRDCEEDLKKAEPALAAAQQALNTLNKASSPCFKIFRKWIQFITAGAS